MKKMSSRSKGGHYLKKIADGCIPLFYESSSGSCTKDSYIISWEHLFLDCYRIELRNSFDDVLGVGDWNIGSNTTSSWVFFS